MEKHGSAFPSRGGIQRATATASGRRRGALVAAQPRDARLRSTAPLLRSRRSRLRSKGGIATGALSRARC